MLLGRARLPFVITSGIGVFEQADIKEVIAFLRVCENGSDRVAFGRLLGLLSGVCEKTIEKLCETLNGHFETRDPQQRARLVAALKPPRVVSAGDRPAAGRTRESLARGEAVQRFCNVFTAPLAGYARESARRCSRTGVAD